MVGHRLNIVNIWWGRGLNWRFVCVVHRKTSLDLISYLNFRIYFLTASNRSPLPPARDLYPNPTHCCPWAAPPKCPGEIWIEVVSLCCLWEGRRDIVFVENWLGRLGSSCCNHQHDHLFISPIQSPHSPLQINRLCLLRRLQFHIRALLLRNLIHVESSCSQQFGSLDGDNCLK